MKALALDLASKTGWASVANGIVTSGVVDFNGGGARFLRFRNWLRDMLNTEKPQIVFYERVDRHLSTIAAHVYGGFLGVMQAELESREIPCKGIPVGTIKKRATGNGWAKKPEMIEAAMAKWPDQEITTHDVADALWILQCGIEQKL